MYQVEPNSRSFQLAGYLGVLAIFVSSRGYGGIWHDNRLYTLQSLFEVFPERFSRDLFFAFGSQNEYTIFTKLHVSAIHLLGLNWANILLVAFGLALWFWGLVRISKHLRLENACWIFLLLVCGLIANYGDFTFRYAESFLTPRLFAEGLILWSIAFFLGQKTLLGFLLLLAAVPIHPLSGITGWAFVAIYLSLKDRRWLLLTATGGITILGLALAGIKPFAGFIQTMDATWFEISYQRNFHAYVTRWGLVHLNTFLADLVLILLALSLAKSNARRLLQTSAILGLAGVIANLIGADLMANLFVIQLQPNRVLWLMHLFSYLGLAILIHSWWQDRMTHAQTMALSLILTAFFTLTFWVSLFLSLASLAIAYKGQSLVSFLETRTLLRRTIFALFPLSVLFWAIRVLVHRHLVITTIIAREVDDSILLAYLHMWILTLTLVAVPLLWWLFYRAKNISWRRSSLAGLVCILLLSLILWDRRGVERRQLEASSFDMHQELDLGIPPHSSVYWDLAKTDLTWFVLKRPSYISWVQGAGLLFFRETAMEWEKRVQRLQDVRVFLDYEDRRLTRILAPDLQGIRRLCQAPDLGYVVFEEDYGGGQSFGVLDEEYYLYDCASMRTETPLLTTHNRRSGSKVSPRTTKLFTESETEE